MTDLSPNFQAVPILDPEREQYHKAVRSYQAHVAHDKASRARLWFWVATASLLLAGTAVAAVVTLLPLKEILPLPLVIHEQDGTVDAGMRLSDLGQNMAEKVIRSSIWRYVQERESYSFSEAKHRYDLVSLMSCDDVKRDYQQWFLHSPDSPQKALGKNGQISAQEISISPVRNTPDGAVYLVRLWKNKQMTGQREDKRSATATVEYVLLHDAPAALILDDPAALCVSRYQIEENTP